ncbi:MAG: GNAT family N-acetyltransferase [Oscillospiraceae bacterium]|nr:GNAT family N-acetyltransferase [Oscillospiraceae bacterium]
MCANDRAVVLGMMRDFYDSPAVDHTAPDATLEKDIDDCLSDLPYLNGFIMERDGQIVGYAMIAVSYTTEYGGICIWVEDLYLQPAYRHCGIGGELLTFLESQYPDAVRFKLEVEPENAAALQCYEKHGYSVSPYSLMTKER